MFSFFGRVVFVAISHEFQRDVTVCTPCAVLYLVGADDMCCVGVLCGCAVWLCCVCVVCGLCCVDVMCPTYSGADAHGPLTGACNPMLCPIHGVRLSMMNATVWQEWDLPGHLDRV